MPETIHERLQAYRKARRLGIDDVRRMLSNHNALTADGHPFRAEHWEKLEAGTAPILVAEAPFIAKVFALTQDQLFAVLSGTNKTSLISDKLDNGGNFGQRLTAHRKQLQLTQQELATKARMAQTYLCRLEKREAAPTFDVLTRVAAGLGISWEKLVPGHLLEDYKLRNLPDEDRKLLDDLADVL